MLRLLSSASGVRKVARIGHWPPLVSAMRRISSPSWRPCRTADRSLSPLNGQANSEGAALAFTTVDRDAATMAGNDLSSNGQAHARAADTPDVVRSLELLEDPRLIVYRHAHPLVAYRQNRPGAILVLVVDDGDADYPALRAVLDGVAQQVVQHALEARPVPFAEQIWLARLLNQVSLRLLLVLGDPLACKPNEVDAAILQFERTLQLPAGNIQHVVDHACHASGR